MEDPGNLMQRTPCTPEVLRYLRGFGAATLNLLGILENEPEAELYVDDLRAPRGVLVKAWRFWYAHTEDEAFLELLCRELVRRGGYQGFSGVWRPLAERLKARFPLVWDAPCETYLLPEGSPLPEPAGHAVGPLALAEAELVDAHYAYRNETSLAKIRACIQHRPSSCVRVDGQPVCWLLVHEDNSFGIMYTLEEHRRKGYAVDVTMDLIGRQLARGGTPFLQIRDDNAMSPGLARRCGFVPEGFCDWFGLMVTPAEDLKQGGAAFRAQVREALEGPGAPGIAGNGAVCLFRFLYPMPPGDPAGNPVVEFTEEAWLPSSPFQAAALGRFRGKLRLLGDRSTGRAIAVLLAGAEDAFELVWLAGREPDLVQRVLERAKALDLGLAFLHVEPEARSLFEAQGFSSAYDERSGA